MCGHGMQYFGGQERCVKFPCSTKCFPWDVTKAGNDRGERENERWEQNRELENEIADRARVQGWFYFPIFHFPVSHACSPLSVPSFSNTRFPRAY